MLSQGNEWPLLLKPRYHKAYEEMTSYQYVGDVIEILGTRCEIMAATKQVQNYANTDFCWPEVQNKRQF